VEIWEYSTKCIRTEPNFKIGAMINILWRLLEY